LAAQFPRQSVFIATKNPGADGAYLKDSTGNRRWWPLALKPRGGQVDFAGLKAARNQLFAEAVVRAKAGEELHMETSELKAEAKAAAGERHAEHPWTERVAGWVLESKADATFLTARDIFIEALGGIDKQLDQRTSRTIAGIMRSLGWSAGVKRVGPRVMRGYHLDGADAAPSPVEEKDLLDGLL
jgi:predicted P-loop ATPase